MACNNDSDTCIIFWGVSGTPAAVANVFASSICFQMRAMGLLEGIGVINCHVFYCDTIAMMRLYVPYRYWNTPSAFLSPKLCVSGYMTSKYM